MTNFSSLPFPRPSPLPASRNSSLLTFFFLVVVIPCPRNDSLSPSLKVLGLIWLPPPPLIRCSLGRERDVVRNVDCGPAAAEECAEQPLGAWLEVAAAAAATNSDGSADISSESANGETGTEKSEVTGNDTSNNGVAPALGSTVDGPIILANGEDKASSESNDEDGAKGRPTIEESKASNEVAIKKEVVPALGSMVDGPITLASDEDKASSESVGAGGVTGCQGIEESVIRKEGSSTSELAGAPGLTADMPITEAGAADDGTPGDSKHCG